MTVRNGRGRLLGIDHGEKVIGLAICDANWTAARPLELLIRHTRAQDFAYIRNVIAKQEIVAVVIGLPELPPEHNVTGQANTVRRWSTRLAAAVNVPVYLWDEQYSSFEAEQIAVEIGLEQAARIDDRAAAIILQSFIDAHPDGTLLPAPVKAR